jgi:hypothetical protein
VPIVMGTGTWVPRRYRPKARIIASRPLRREPPACVRMRRQGPSAA